MNTLHRPDVVALLDELYADARQKDPPAMARLRALGEAERKALFSDYRRMYGEAREAYLPVDRVAGELLYLFARMRGARSMVEFGTSFGISTVFLAAALADNGGGRLITSELEPTKAARAVENLARVGLDGLVESRTGDALETLADVPGPVDFVYLDGAKPLYLPVLRLLEPRLAPRAVVAADNLSMVELLAPFTDYVRAPANGYLSLPLPIGDGVELTLRT